MSVYKCLHNGNGWCPNEKYKSGRKKNREGYEHHDLNFTLYNSKGRRGKSSRQFGSDCHQLIDIDELDPTLQLLCRFMEYIRYFLVSTIIRADTFIFFLFQDILSPDAKFRSKHPKFPSIEWFSIARGLAIRNIEF